MLHVGHDPLPEHTGFNLFGSKLPVAGNVTDIGISIDPQLRFTAHIIALVSTAHARACLIQRCFISRDRPTLIKAYITYCDP